MIRQLSSFIERTSESLPRFILATLLGPATLFLVLFPIMRAFTAVTGGVQPFDWQENLTAVDVARQLPLYAGAPRELYFAHAAVDTVFPVFAAAFFGAIAAFALRHGAPRIYQRAISIGAFAVYFASVPFDYCENLASVAAIMAYPTPPGAWAEVMVATKAVKVATEAAIPAATALSIVVAAGGWLGARLGLFQGKT